MKKDIKKEYDFSKGVKNPYAKSLIPTNIYTNYLKIIRNLALNT